MRGRTFPSLRADVASAGPPSTDDEAAPRKQIGAAFNGMSGVTRWLSGMRLRCLDTRALECGGNIGLQCATCRALERLVRGGQLLSKATNFA